MAVGKSAIPGERVNGDADENNSDEKAEAKMANFLVWSLLLAHVLIANQTILKRILNFGNSLDWFLMGMSILTAIGSGTVRIQSNPRRHTFNILTSFGDRLYH